MANEIISYLEMCQREGASLQRGMNYRIASGHSVILMSLRRNAPYRDHIEGDGSVLIYEGHDVPRSSANPLPKNIDQPRRTPSGSLTENGKFEQAARETQQDLRAPEWVSVYEKLREGIWSYNGVFELVDCWQEFDGHREVFKFKLVAIEDTGNPAQFPGGSSERRRIIPTAVKLEVWKRDGGRCVKCGATNELHFDHDLPFAKGGTSLTAANVQLLCARHNLQKSDRIQ